MTDEARFAALQRRGYTRRQSEFLTLVLLNIGYSLRRQHAALFRVADGSCTTEFVRGLMQRHLATRRVFDRQTQVFRTGSRMLYDVIGEPDSRLRRAAEPDAVTQRLMTLDVLIACRERPYLATETEKVEFFTDLFNVPIAALPSQPLSLGSARCASHHAPLCGPRARAPRERRPDLHVRPTVGAAWRVRGLSQRVHAAPASPSSCRDSFLHA